MQGTPARKTLIAKVVAASSADDWAQAQQEWDLVGRGYDMAHRGVCACSQQGLHRLFRIENRITGAQLWPIGSTCIIEHFDGAPELRVQLRQQVELLAMERLVQQLDRGQLDLKRDMTRSRLRTLRDKQFVSPREYEYLLTAFNRRRDLEWDELLGVEKIMREVVVPVLGGEEIEAAEVPDYVAGVDDGRLEVDVKGATAAYLIGYHDGGLLRDVWNVYEDHEEGVA